MHCRYKLFTQPEEFIKANWIRPEDVGYYEDTGINSLKIIDRNRKTQDIVFALRAYLERRFDGNLIDLLFYIHPSSKETIFLKGLRFFLHPLQINIFKLIKIKQLFPDIGVYVDNRKLDGFLKYFSEGKCKSCDCNDCGYCRGVAERVVHIDEACRRKSEKAFQEIIGSLTKGDMFRYF